MGLNHDRRKPDEGLGGSHRYLRLWRLPFLICLLLLLVEAGGEPVREALRYAREPIAQGEIWRLLSGHLVHLGWTHFLMNAVALLLIWALVGERLNAQRWLLAMFLIVVTIDAGFWFIDRQLVWYVGLSGVLHGILLAGLVAGWPEARTESLILAGLLALKLVYEQVVGPLPGSESTAGGAVVVNAHLYGAVGGLLGGLLLRVRAVRLRTI